MKYLFGFLAVLLLVSFTNNELFTQTGNASYYSAKMHGRRTASGEKYHKDSLVCAHKTLPFGTRLRITNLRNDSVIEVRVIDRMGKSSPHIIDLSTTAARQLGFLGKGISKVKVEELQPISTMMEPEVIAEKKAEK
jgi:rare lipoprotein A